MKYKFEEQAQRNDPMPDGLTALEQQTYILLRNIYWALNKGIVSKEQAQREKNLILKDLGDLNTAREFERKCWENSARRTVAAERAMAMYRKSRTLENADELVSRLEWLHDECARPVLMTKCGAACPACKLPFAQERADRRPAYCEDCGCRLAWEETSPAPAPAKP